MPVASDVKSFDNILNSTFLVVTKALLLGLNYFIFNAMSLQPSKFTPKTVSSFTNIHFLNIYNDKERSAD